jgi:hypothetical protein
LTLRERIVPSGPLSSERFDWAAQLDKIAGAGVHFRPDAMSDEDLRVLPEGSR